MANFLSSSLRWVLPVAITSLLPLGFATAQTVVYTNAGVYTNVAPAGVNKVTFKLWGAGGGGGGLPFPGLSRGGGGAFSSVTLDVQPGQTFIVVVGQRGAIGSASLGGAGSGNTIGGPPGVFEGSNGRGQGGQGSSVFFLTNDLLVMKAVAGAGGGGSFGGNGGAAGHPGQNDPPAIGGLPGDNGSGGAGGGGNYNNSAITTGISSLNQAGGNGGAGILYSGGGGGGYGGGAGGSGTPEGGAGGGGGGSYGTIVTTGFDQMPGNTSDTNYIGSAGQGGIGPADGSDGLAVVLWTSANAPAPTTLQNPARLGDGSFQFSFTNASGAAFTAFATTNLSASSNWTSVGSATETSPGQFQFTDTQATNFPLRFYQIRSP